MIIGIMQPYFMPYLGYFSLIKHTDRFILFDTVQYIRHGWIERNRILKQTGGWQYIQVPIIKEQGRSSIIKDVKINNSTDWGKKILSQLQHYKKKAPFYRQVISLLEEIFSKKYEDIVTLNTESLRFLCQYLGINTPLEIFSKMHLDIKTANAPDEWALNICEALPRVDSYVNPIGGESFFDPRKYEDAGIKLLFQHMDLKPYNQRTETFEVALSIIDVLMFNSIAETNILLDYYKFQHL